MQYATAKRLREERAKVAADMRSISDKAFAEGRKDLSAEEDAKFNALSKEYDSYMGSAEKPGPLARAERVDAISAEMNAAVEPLNRLVGRNDFDGGQHRPAGGDGGSTPATEEQRALAIQGWMRSQMGYELSDSHQAAARATGLMPWAQSLRIQTYSTEQLQGLQRAFRQGHASSGLDRARDYKAALSTQSGTIGGYLIPPETLMRELEVNMLAYGGMRQVAGFISTSSGERLSWPTGDDTGNVGILLGQNTAAPTTGGQPSLTKVYWDAYKFSSNSPDGTPILVPYELLQDSAIDLVKQLGEWLAERLGRISNTYYTTGTGNSQPKGIVTAATAFAAISSTAISFDDLFGLIHSIDPAYRTGDCGFMCHDNTVLAIRKLKDGIGRNLWEPGLQVGAPDRILSYAWTVNQAMDSTFASGKNTMLFGQLYKYKIRRVNGGLDGGLRLYRLQERYRDVDQDGFLALMREDGNLLTAGTPPVKVLHHT